MQFIKKYSFEISVFLILAITGVIMGYQDFSKCSCSHCECPVGSCCK